MALHKYQLSIRFCPKVRILMPIYKDINRVGADYLGEFLQPVKTVIFPRNAAAGEAQTRLTDSGPEDLGRKTKSCRTPF